MSQPSPSKPEPPEGEDSSNPLFDEANRRHAEVEAESETKADDDLRTLWLDSDDAGDLISSLSSETARSIVVDLHDQHRTASELADSVGTSVQNVRHHLDSLKESGLVEVVDTRYSSKGREMDVYAPVDRPMVVFVGREKQGNGFVDSLKRFLGAIGVLGAMSLVVQYLVVTRFGTTPVEGIPQVNDGVGGGFAPLGMPPGLLFFAGGALVLAMASLWTVYRDRRS